MQEIKIMKRNMCMLQIKKINVHNIFFPIILTKSCTKHGKRVHFSEILELLNFKNFLSPQVQP